MAEFRLSQLAHEDRAYIYRRGYFKWGEQHADRFDDKLEQRLLLLADFPTTGITLKSPMIPWSDLHRAEFKPFVIWG